jgi:hypothetical protein
VVVVCEGYDSKGETVMEIGHTGRKNRRDFCLKEATPGVLRKSAETVDWKRVTEILFFEECGRS